mgnify:CR=1 FL=1
MKKIETSAAPAAIGPYSQGIKIGNVVYCSGQIPVDPATGTVAGTAIAEQAEQSCKNVGAVLAAGGASYGKDDLFSGRYDRFPDIQQRL